MSTGGRGIGFQGSEGRLPGEVALAALGFLLPAVWTLIVAARSASQILQIPSEDISSRGTAALLVVVLLVALVGLAALGVAGSLYHRSRIGPGLAFTFALTFTAAVLMTPGPASTVDIVTVLSSIAASLLIATSLQDYDVPPTWSRAPTSVALSRRLIEAFAIFALVCSLLYFLLGSDGGPSKFTVAAVISLAWGAASALFIRGLEQANPVARVGLSAGGVLYLIAMSVIGHFVIGTLVPIGFVAAALIGLWVPADARGFFEPAQARG